MKFNALIPRQHSPQLPGFHDYPNFNYEYVGLERHGSLSYWWNILLKRKWWALGVFLGVVLVVGLITFITKPVYKATATLQIIQDNPSAIVGDRDPLTTLQVNEDQSRFYESQYMILNSRPMSQSIIESLNLKDHPEFKILADGKEKMTQQEFESKCTDKFFKMLEITPLKKSYLVEVSFKSTDRHLAQKVPNAIYKEYVNFSMNTRQQSYTLIKEWLSAQLQQLGNKVERSERELYTYGKKKDFMALEGDDNVIVKKYVELSRLLTTAQAERTRKEGEYRQIQERGVDTPVITNNPLIQKLREEVVLQKAKVASLGKIYGDNYPQFQVERAKLSELQARMNNETGHIRGSIEADYQAALKTEKLLREELEAQKGKVADLQENLVEHHNLKRDVQTNEQLYQALLSRMKEASLKSTMVASNVAVIAPAELPIEPYSPKKTMNMLIGCLFGLVGGIASAFLLEHLDKSIKTIGELENICRIPSLGVVPLISNKDNSESEENKQLELITFNDPKSLVSEAIHHITASLSADKPEAIMVTSPNPNEGKTTISINLAASLAAMGQKVVLIDADLRNPSCHYIFQKPSQPGLSNFLLGSASASEIIQSTSIPNLFFIPAGEVPSNPIVLLHSKDLHNLLVELRNDFQHIIVDTPPIVGFADSKVISSLMDGVVLVLKHHYTSREAAKLAMKHLRQINCNTIGCILNMARCIKYGYSDYGGYYHKSGYYQGPSLRTRYCNEK